MVSTIQVREVIEQNDCAGKKYITVTAMEGDETIRSRFRLNHGFMPAYDKLLLACVAPMDVVEVNGDYMQPDLLVVGEFVENLTPFTNRTPSCLCGKIMVSDGFSIYCSNDDCPLTLVARLNRLGNTSFFRPDLMMVDPELEFYLSQSGGYSTSSDYYKPFSCILHGLFWGEPGGSLDTIFLNRRHKSITLANFLVEPLFQDLIEHLDQPQGIFNNHTYASVYQFYRDMDELTQRRDIHSERQNVLLFEFLWSLGIEALTENHIKSLFAYERTLSGSIDIMVMCAYVLTHATELVHELGMHLLEARAILTEVYRRRYEFHDIFYHFSGDNPDVILAFRNLKM